MRGNIRVTLFAFAFFASAQVPVTADGADESAMKNLYAALQGNKPTDAVEPAPMSTSKDLAANPPPVSEAAPEAPVTSVDSKTVESPVAAEKSAMETLLDRTWPVGQADTEAEPASLTDLAPVTLPTAASVPAEQVSVAASKVEIPVDAEKSAMETLLDRTWPVAQAKTGADEASLTELAPATLPISPPVSAEEVSLAANKVEIPVDAEKSAMETLLDRTWPVGQADNGAAPASLTELSPSTLPTAATVPAEQVSVAANKVEKPANAEKSALDTLLDRTWPVGQADATAEPASLTELAPAAILTAAPVSAEEVSEVASQKNIVVADEANAGVGEPRQSGFLNCSTSEAEEHTVDPAEMLLEVAGRASGSNFVTVDSMGNLITVNTTSSGSMVQKTLVTQTTGDEEVNNGLAQITSPAMPGTSFLATELFSAATGQDVDIYMLVEHIVKSNAATERGDGMFMFHMAFLPQRSESRKSLDELVKEEDQSATPKTVAGKFRSAKNFGHTYGVPKIMKKKGDKRDDPFCVDDAIFPGFTPEKSLVDVLQHIVNVEGKTVAEDNKDKVLMHGVWLSGFDNPWNPDCFLDAKAKVAAKKKRDEYDALKQRVKTSFHVFHEQVSKKNTKPAPDTLPFAKEFADLGIKEGDQATHIISDPKQRKQPGGQTELPVPSFVAFWVVMRDQDGVEGALQEWYKQINFDPVAKEGKPIYEIYKVTQPQSPASVPPHV